MGSRRGVLSRLSIGPILVEVEEEYRVSVMIIGLMRLLVLGGSRGMSIGMLLLMGVILSWVTVSPLAKNKVFVSEAQNSRLQDDDFS
jgi:hypothetical protein